MIKIALATCLKLPEPDPDARPLLDAVRAAGAAAEWVAWDDPAADFGRYDACVIRSTWNYIHRLPAYLAWAERVARRARLLNPPEVVRWNTDKAYLGELERRGVRIVPTAFVPRGDGASLEAVLAGRGWREVVVKPRVGAGSFSTRRFGPGQEEEGGRFLRGLAAERDALVQPYIRSVEGYGERALVWIAGELTHSVRKTSRFADQGENVLPVPVEDDERAFALKVLEPWARDLLYARVDVARAEDGGLMVMELELVEPSLFLVQEPRALRRMAEACAAAVKAPLK